MYLTFTPFLLLVWSAMCLGFGVLGTIKVASWFKPKAPTTK